MKSRNDMKQTKRIIIALYNMGGPSGQEDVEPFLRALFNDPDLLDIPMGSLLQGFVADKIIKKRLEEVKARYQLMGGGSPQLIITQRVAAKLKEALLSKTPSTQLFCDGSSHECEPPYCLVDVLPLFRYSAPRAEEILQLCIEQQIDELWLLSQYPHCARATTGTSLRELGLLQHSNPKFSEIKIRTFAGYGDEPEFIEIWSKRVIDSWNALPNEKKHLVISAHNLPLSYVAEGGPYPQQIRRTAQEVMRRHGLHETQDWTLCWQSAVGPVRWMTPTTERTLEELCASGVEHILVWPIAFVSDHIETLVEIDIEYAEFAKARGAKTFSRVKNLDDDNDFVSFLKNKVEFGAGDLNRRTVTPLLRDLVSTPSGPFCSSQAGGCLCANYFLSGKNGLARGKSYSRIDSKTFAGKKLGD